MTLVQLRHFLALAETGSFSRAAAKVFLTQPALSRSIAALEDELAVPLLDRVGRRIELTPFGLATLERARQLLFDAQDLRVAAQQMSGGVAGTLRIGMGSGPGAMLMTPLLLKMGREQPQVKLEVTRSNTELLVQALRERRLDAIVVDARSLRPSADLKTELMRDMKGAFMVRKGHPLLRMRGPVSFESVQRYPLASTPLSDEVARVLIERYGPQADPQHCITLRCEEISSLVDVARRSPAVLVAIRSAAPDLVELKMKPALNATARFGLVTLARRTEHPGLAVVRELMDEQLRD